MGIDLGTSSVKILLMNKSGKIISTLTKTYSISFPKPLWSEQNPNEWWEVTKTAIKEILKTQDKSLLKGISFSGQMHGLVILDENDNVIRPAILWNDQRTEKECDYLNNTIGKNLISQYTGNIALTGFTAPKILWVKNNEHQNFNLIKKIMLPKDYIAYKLSGVFATDMSDASGTLLFDVKNRTWSKEMLDIIGIYKSQLPKLFESYESIGYIKPELAEEFGISKNVKIVIGGGDQAVGAIGTGAVEEGIISVALGTSGVIFAPFNNYKVVKDNSLHSFAHANGKYHQMGVMLSAAAAFKWWVETINNTTNYEKINNEISKINPGSDNLYFLPYLMGERTPHNDVNAKGCFIGLTLSHTNAHMSRAVIEGVTYGLNDSMEILKNLGINIEKIRISGGGAKSDIWKQIVADVFNAKVSTIEVIEGPAYGAAILAAVGCNEYNSVDEACKNIIKDVETFIPNENNVKIYKEKYKTFATLYPTLKNSFKIL
jgi:xylulokinase